MGVSTLWPTIFFHMHHLFGHSKCRCFLFSDENIRPRESKWRAQVLQMYVAKLKDHVPLSPLFLYYIALSFCNKYVIQNQHDFLRLIISNSWKLTLLLYSYFLQLKKCIQSSFLYCYRELTKWCIWNTEQMVKCHPKERGDNYTGLPKAFLYYCWSLSVL